MFIERTRAEFEGELLINGTLLTSTAAELNLMDGVTATAAEINYLDIAALGTGAASKAVVLDSGDDFTWPAAGVLTYGGTAVTANGAELNLVDNQVAGVTWTIGAEAASVINVGMQLTDAAGTDMATTSALRVYLADDSAGLNITGTGPDGAVAIGTDGSMIASGGDSKINFLCVSEADGDIDFNMTNVAGTPSWYAVAVLPNGKLDISAVITFTSDT